MSKFRYLIILAITIIVALIALTIDIRKDVPTIYTFTISDISVSENVVDEAESDNQISYDEYSQMIIDDLKSIECLRRTNRSKYQTEYYTILGKYSIFDLPETLEDCYTDDELMRLYGVVEAEVGDLGGFEERLNVASVIFNRMNDEGFDEDINNILTKDQFATIRNGTYKRVVITKETVLACHYAFDIERINDCLYFESGDSRVHDKYAEFVFEDASGHRFYK